MGLIMPEHFLGGEIFSICFPELIHEHSAHPSNDNETSRFVTKAEPFITGKWTGPADTTAETCRVPEWAGLRVWLSLPPRPLRSPVRARHSLRFGGVINVTRSPFHPLQLCSEPEPSLTGAGERSANSLNAFFVGINDQSWKLIIRTGTTTTSRLAGTRVPWGQCGEDKKAEHLGIRLIKTRNLFQCQTFTLCGNVMVKKWINMVHIYTFLSWINPDKSATDWTVTRVTILTRCNNPHRWEYASSHKVLHREKNLKFY